MKLKNVDWSVVFMWTMVALLVGVIFWAVVYTVKDNIEKNSDTYEPPTADSSQEICMVFEEGRLVSHTNVGHYDNVYTYVCYNDDTEQYSFCEPVFVGCE